MRPRLEKIEQRRRKHEQRTESRTGEELKTALRQPDRPEACPWAWPRSRRPQRGRLCPGRRTAREMKAVLKRLMAYLEQDRLKMGLAFFCVLISTVTSLAGAYMLRPIINQFIAPADGSAGSVSGLAGGLAVMAAVYMASVAASYLQSRIMLTVAQDALLRIPGRPVFQDAEAAGAVL